MSAIPETHKNDVSEPALGAPAVPSTAVHCFVSMKPNRPKVTMKPLFHCPRMGGYCSSRAVEQAQKRNRRIYHAYFETKHKTTATKPTTTDNRRPVCRGESSPPLSVKTRDLGPVRTAKLEALVDFSSRLHTLFSRFARGSLCDCRTLHTPTPLLPPLAPFPLLAPRP